MPRPLGSAVQPPPPCAVPSLWISKSQGTLSGLRKTGWTLGVAYLQHSRFEVLTGFQKSSGLFVCSPLSLLLGGMPQA